MSRELWRCVQTLTREEVCAWCVARWTAMEDAGAIQRPHVEAVSEEEQIEALFRHVYASQREEDANPGALNGEPPGAAAAAAHHRKLLAWLTGGMSVGAAYAERAAMHTRAKCFLQAQQDAKRAIACFGHQFLDSAAKNSEGGAKDARNAREARVALAAAYARLGAACDAERGHPDRDAWGAARAYARCVDLWPEHAGYVEEKTARTHARTHACTFPSLSPPFPFPSPHFR